KAHVNTFVIISGDSDFSPLVSKLRENAKTVIGVGVKQSTSDLLIANCDEFIFYDDLVRESQRAADQRAASTAARRKPGDDKRRNKDDLEARRTQAVELATETFDALVAERGDSGKIWASVLKEAIKRRRPDFSESYFGFRAFGNLLEEAQSRGLLSFGRDEKSGAYVYRNSSTVAAEADHLADTADNLSFDASAEQTTPEASDRERGHTREASESRRRQRGSRSASRRRDTDAPREDGPRDEAHDTAPTAPFVIPDTDVSQPDVTPSRTSAAHIERHPETPDTAPAVRTAFDPHAPENTTPASSESDDEAAAPRAKRAARAGRTTRKPRATPAQDTTGAAEASASDNAAPTSTQAVRI
ncbi:MAG: NYN domain-containing protein, partial [Comamonadaceae bacterium]